MYESTLIRELCVPSTTDIDRAYMLFSCAFSVPYIMCNHYGHNKYLYYINSPKVDDESLRVCYVGN